MSNEAPGVLEEALIGPALPVQLETEGGKVVALPPNWRAMTERSYHELSACANGDPWFETVDSFVDYVNRFGSTDTAVFMEVQQSKSGHNLPGEGVVAVIDYHGAQDDPDRCSHKAGLSTELHRAFEFWLKSVPATMTQKEFARFVRQHRQFVDPAHHADLVTVGQKFSLNVSRKFSQATDLDVGTVSLAYSEDAEPISAPTQFVVQPPVFACLDTIQVKLEVAISYEIDEEGRLKILLSRDSDWDEAIDQATDMLRGEIRSRLTTDYVYRGRVSRRG